MLYIYEDINELSWAEFYLNTIQEQANKNYQDLPKVVMQNSLQHRAFSLTNNLFMNFTTKFVKGVNNQSNSPNTSNKQTYHHLNPSSKSLKKPVDQSNINRNLSSLINQPSIVKHIQKNTKVTPLNQYNPSDNIIKNNNQQIHTKAMNLTSNSYMNNTTKYVKGHNSSPKKQDGQNAIMVASKSKDKIQIPTNQKTQRNNPTRNVQQQKQVKLSPGKKSFTNINSKQKNQQIIVLSSPRQVVSKRQTNQKTESAPLNASVNVFGALLNIKSETIMDKAMNMTSNVFMNSTTKFVKGLIPSAKQIQIDKKMFGNAFESKSLDRKNRFKAQLVNNIMNKIQNVDNQNHDKSQNSSRSSSVGRLSRKKQRTRELKFLQKKQKSQLSIENFAPNTNQNVTNKNTAITALLNTLPAQTNQTATQNPIISPSKKMPQSTTQIAKVIQNKATVNPENKMRNNEVNKQQNNDNRYKGTHNKNIEANKQVIDNKKIQENPKPFSRQNQNKLPQKKQIVQIQSTPKIYQTQKTIPSIPSGQLPLETPIKQVKPYPRQPDNKPQNIISAKTINKPEVSSIQEEKSYQIQKSNNFQFNKNQALKQQKTAQITAVNQNFDRLWTTPRPRVQQVKSAQTQRISPSNNKTVQMTSKTNKNVKVVVEKVQSKPQQNQSLKTTIKNQNFSKNITKQSQTRIIENKTKPQESQLSKISIKSPQNNKKSATTINIIQNDNLNKNNKGNYNNNKRQNNNSFIQNNNSKQKKSSSIQKSINQDKIEIKAPINQSNLINNNSNKSNIYQKAQPIPLNSQSAVQTNSKPFQRKPAATLPAQTNLNRNYGNKALQRQAITQNVSQITQKKNTQVSSQTNINRNYLQKKPIQSPQPIISNRSTKQIQKKSIQQIQPIKQRQNQLSNKNISRLSNNISPSKDIQSSNVSKKVTKQSMVIQKTQTKQLQTNPNIKMLKTSYASQRNDQKQNARSVTTLPQSKATTNNRIITDKSPQNNRYKTQIKSQMVQNQQQKDSKKVTNVTNKISPRKVEQPQQLDVSNKQDITVKKANINEAKILLLASIHIHRNLYLNNLRIATEKFKRIIISQDKLIKQINNVDKRKSSSIALVFRVLNQKFKDHFSNFKFKVWFSNKSQGKITEKKENIQVLQDKKDLTYFLGQLNIIISNYYLYNKKYPAFNKILLHSSLKQRKNNNSSSKQAIIQPNIQPETNKAKSPASKFTKPPRDYQSQKINLTNSKNLVQREVTSIQRSIQSKKGSIDSQKNRLIKKLQGERKKNTTLQKQVADRRKKNKQIKSILDKIPSDKLQLQLNQYQNIIQSLTEVYSHIFRQQKSTINVDQLIKLFNLVKSDQSSLLEQWLILHKNLMLKHVISIWQGGQNQLKKTRQKLQGQQEVVSKLVSSYVRERYLWQWIKITADSV